MPLKARGREAAVLPRDDRGSEAAGDDMWLGPADLMLRIKQAIIILKYAALAL